MQKGLQSCILGERHVYQRKDLETCCYISEEKVFAVNHTLCFCSEEDYEWCVASLACEISYWF